MSIFWHYAFKLLSFLPRTFEYMELHSYAVKLSFYFYTFIQVFSILLFIYVKYYICTFIAMY